MRDVAVYIYFDHPRIRYTLQQMLNDWLGLKLHFFTQPEPFLHSSLPKISYGKAFPDPKTLFFPAHPWMCSRSPSIPEVYNQLERPCLFPISQKRTQWSFDLVAMTFFLLSRAEEYGAETSRDAHLRFPAAASLAFQSGFLHRPLLDEWLEVLRKQLLQQFPQLSLPSQTYQFRPTLDVDYFWAFRQRPLYQLAGGLAKSILKQEWSLVQKRGSSLFSGQDPFYTFPQLHQWHGEARLAAYYFVHVGNYGPFDRPNDWRRPAVREAIRQLAKHAKHVGLHPSYKAAQDFQQFQIEKTRLEQILGRAVTQSRQHFLRLELPRQYQWLLSMGIQEDFTMGYADHFGFRASTSRSFLWYDLSREAPTPLRIHPFALMDTTLKHYLRQSVPQAKTTLEELTARVKAVNGCLTTLWHNSSFSEVEGWEEWAALYPWLLDIARPK